DDDAFLEQLRELRPSIYFQFDGFEAETYRLLRGEPAILPQKLRALDRLAEVGANVVLVPAVDRFINLHEVGAIVSFGLQHPAVRGINFQPAFRSGRHIASDSMQRLTIPDILTALEEQTDGMLKVSDFVPVPCCFPTCNSVTYVLNDGETVLPLTRVLNVEDYLDYITNRAVPDLSEEIKVALEGLWSSSAVAGSDKAAQQFALSCAACGLPGGLDLAAFARQIFMIMLQDFMDPWTFNQKNVMKCCKEMLLPDGKQIPFCAYNNVGYREQAREQLQARERRRNQARRMDVPYTPEPLTFSFEHVPGSRSISPGVKGAANGHEA
ncbi:MAG TPA: radical SAM protein, partial [Ktedonobacteraceae bacterium]|nr:radical SAM protein [Ktedonobacteraceae bacterium]